jgi:hypothetical protein
MAAALKSYLSGRKKRDHHNMSVTFEYPLVDITLSG